MIDRRLFGVAFVFVMLCIGMWKFGPFGGNSESQSARPKKSANSTVNRAQPDDQKTAKKSATSVEKSLAEKQDSGSMGDSDSVATALAQVRAQPRPFPTMQYMPKGRIDPSGFTIVRMFVEPWSKGADLAEVSSHFDGAGERFRRRLELEISSNQLNPYERAKRMLMLATMFNYDGMAKEAYQALVGARQFMSTQPAVAQELFYTLIYFQGVTALRIGENENCIMCRGESSCILPIAKSAQHKYQSGSRIAIEHFTEYLERFPDDLEAKWLLNAAYMTLGEYPDAVPSEHLVKIPAYLNDGGTSIGKFRDVGAMLGVNRFNQAGGAILDDFDNDGYFDIVTTSFDRTAPMAYFRNRLDGRFDNLTEAAGLNEQLGGLNSMQTDYNNDGLLDIFIVRGAWLRDDMSVRPTLLRNDGDSKFTDVTAEAGLSEPMNSITASWQDFDRDGWLDLLVCGESQRNRLYRNLQNGTFEEVAEDAGLAGFEDYRCKGATWIDFDRDGYPDVFLNFLSEKGACLYRNMQNGTFVDVSKEMGIDGPYQGFACWAWDYDNDGWEDIFATSYEHSLEASVLGMMGEEHSLRIGRLYRNVEGKAFEDVARQAGLTEAYMTMGCNFGDFDNDGFLDFYLGTGEPSIAYLVPNRMFRNMNGTKFEDITTSTGTGSLQKGHGVGCGDWDRDGDVDLFVEMGGAINGDRFHNIMFQNPGQGNNWIALKLIGATSNRAAIGSQIKVTTNGDKPMDIYRKVTSGSSFGASPLEQTIGLGKSTGIETVEITWPSGTSQKFESVELNHRYIVREDSNELQTANVKPLDLPSE